MAIIIDEIKWWIRYMEFCKVLFGANAGVAVEIYNRCVWIDFMHMKKIDGFSTLYPELQMKIMGQHIMRNPDVIFYSHRHPDHYSRILTEAALDICKDAVLVMPWNDFNGRQVCIKESHEKLKIHDINLCCHRLQHEGDDFRDEENYGCIFEINDFRFLTLGDSSMELTQLQKWEEVCGVDLAFLNFPWITLEKGRNILKHFLKPKHIAINHLPFVRDDCYGYNTAVVKSAEKFFGDVDVRILNRPLQTEMIPID